MTFGASEPIFQTRKCSLLTGGGGGGSYYDGDIRVCIYTHRTIITYFICFYARMHLQKAGVQISRCLSATEEPGEYYDWRIGAGMPSPARGHTMMVTFEYACMHACLYPQADHYRLLYHKPLDYNFSDTNNCLA